MIDSRPSKRCAWTRYDPSAQESCFLTADLSKCKHCTIQTNRTHQHTLLRVVLKDMRKRVEFNSRTSLHDCIIRRKQRKDRLDGRKFWKQPPLKITQKSCDRTTSGKINMDPSVSFPTSREGNSGNYVTKDVVIYMTLSQIVYYCHINSLYWSANPFKLEQLGVSL